MATHEVRILHVAIEAPLARAYDFAHRPENFPKWAAGLADRLYRTDEGWIAATPAGEAHVRFSPPNAHGVLDHWVCPPGQPEIYVPLRLLANGSGTLVELVLFRQLEMAEADFDRDVRSVERDLAALKKLLESAVAG